MNSHNGPTEVPVPNPHDETHKALSSSESKQHGPRHHDGGGTPEHVMQPGEHSNPQGHDGITSH